MGWNHLKAIFRYKSLSVGILEHYSYFTILIEDRSKKAADSAQPGQSNIMTSIFARNSCAHDQNELAACEGAALDAFESEAHIPVQNTIAIQDTFINDVKNHTNQDN